MATSDKPVQEPKELDPTVVNRFLAQQLTEIEVAHLEKQLAANPAVSIEVEATARLKVGLRKLRETGELDELLQPPPRSYRTTFAWAAAAILLIGMVALTGRLASNDTGLLLATSVQEFKTSGMSLAISKPYRLVRTRGSDPRRSYRAVIELPQTRQALALRLFPRLGTRPPYRVAIAAIQDRSRRLLASITVPAADEDLFVTVFIDSSTLQSGDYAVELSSAIAPNGVPEQFSIQVRPATTR